MFFLITILLLVGIYEFWTREQSIDFVKYMPKSFTYCNESILPTNEKYIELKQWFILNTDGWENTPVTYAQVNELRSENMYITLFKSGVVINYTKDGKEWYQVINKKNKSELSFTCNLANKSLKDGTPVPGVP